MKNEIQVFQFDNNQIEVLEFNGKVLFNPRDIGTCLGISDSGIKMAISRMNENQVIKLTNNDRENISAVTSSDFRILNNTGENFITESGVYKMIMQSRKPEAEKFQDWITDEVIPSIRKTGGYLSPAVDFSDPSVIMGLLENWKKDREKLLVANDKIAEDAPKVEFFDAVTDSKDAVEMATVAKVINMGIGRNTLFDFLRFVKVLRKNNEPYEKYVDNGWFRVIEQKFSKPDGTNCINIKTVVYQKGVNGIRRLIEKEMDNYKKQA